MKDLDEKIKAVLREKSELPDLVEEPNIAEELLIAFQGRHRFANMMAVVISLGFLAVAIWSGLRFYEATEVRVQLLWGGLCLFMLIFISFMKVWMWMEMHSNRVLREIKRVELLLLQKLG
jgi:ABC-type multidrug transport system fused ATPase/permease subunit